MGWLGLHLGPWGKESGKEPGALCSLSGTASSLRRPGLYTELRSQSLNTPLTSVSHVI